MIFNLKPMLTSKIKLILVSSLLLAITYFIYQQGFNGGFLLDDSANLYNLKLFHDYTGFESIKNYLMSFHSGFLKRPISSLTFLLNADDWPAEPYFFKLTNFIIHMINGFLLFFASKLLLKLTKFDNKLISKVALVSALLWLLHPFFVSTVMYVIQRMSILATTFSLLGIIFYSKGRLIYKSNRRRSLFYLVTSIFVFTSLATLSKENGILLPLLLYIFEIVIVSKTTYSKLNVKHKVILFYIPLLVIVLALIYKAPEILKQYDYKDFGLIERLLSEARVVSHYIYHLLIPNYFTEGVFGDGVMKSTGLFNPISTFLSVLFLFSLFLFAIMYKKIYPILSFSILFFFAGHLLESTFIPLDLYYEHRNYLPALFLPLPLSILLIKLQQKNPFFVILTIILISFLSVNTYLRNKLWSENTNLIITTANKFPESIRASTIAASMIAEQGYGLAAINVLKKSFIVNKNISTKINILTLKCMVGNINNSDIVDFYENIKNLDFNVQDSTALGHFFNTLYEKACLVDSEILSYKTLDILRSKDVNISKNKVINNHLTYLYALTSAKYENYEITSNEMYKLINEPSDFPVFYKSSDIIKVLITKKEYDRAMNILDQLEPLLNSRIYDTDVYRHREKAKKMRLEIIQLRDSNG